MGSSRPDDRELVRRLLRGDREAVAAIDRWIQAAARSFQRRLAGDWDDVLQDLRLEVLRLLQEGQFRGESRLKTYVWRVVAHTCLDKIRSQKKWQWTGLDNAEILDRSRRRSAEQSRWSDARDLLRRVLKEVPEECRKIWAMIVTGMSYREMGEKLKAAEGTLRVRALRCRRKALAVRARLLAGENAGSL